MLPDCRRLGQVMTTLTASQARRVHTFLLAVFSVFNFFCEVEFELSVFVATCVKQFMFQRGNFASHRRRDRNVIRIAWPWHDRQFESHDAAFVGRVFLAVDHRRLQAFQTIRRRLRRVVGNRLQCQDSCLHSFTLLPSQSTFRNGTLP